MGNAGGGGAQPQPMRGGEQLVVVADELIDFEAQRDLEMDGIVTAQWRMLTRRDEITTREIDEFDMIECLTYQLLGKLLGAPACGAEHLGVQQP